MKRTLIIKAIEEEADDKGGIIAVQYHWEGKFEIGEDISQFTNAIRRYMDDWDKEDEEGEKE